MPQNTNFEIPVTVAGIRFRNPFYVSSGPTTMTVEQLERADACGWGGASLKLTVDPVPYINRHPRYNYYPEKTFLTFTAERRLVLSDLLKLIELGRRRAPGLVLFSNITYSEPGVEGWVNMARKCQEAGVHINELNMCCPNMSFNVEVSGKSKGGPKTGASLGQNEQAIADIVKAVKAETTVPLFVKITPEGGHQAEIARAALTAGADAVGGNANRLGVPPVNIYDPTRSAHPLQKEIGMACLNGEWLKPLALRDTYTMRKECGPDAAITGTGGVTTWEDAVEMIMCGADLVGICTATLVHGFGFMPEFIGGFREFMEAKSYRTPSDMRDILVPAITSAPELTIYAGHARKTAHSLVAPCTYACPNSVPAQGYVRKVAEEEFEEAYQLIMSRSPLQSVCGRICDHPCETECTRGLMDEPVMIRAIKRFVLDMAEREGWKPRILDAKAEKKKSKVAVVGSGPAGLACAYDLARAGYAVTVFEASSRPGGMLTSCIPRFRIDPTEIGREIDVVRALGVEFRTKTALGHDLTLKGLGEDGFSAIFLGLGAQEGARLGIPGEDIPGCLSAVDFLRAVRNGEPARVGPRVAVIGGGFTALDAARTALRLNADEVFLLYRRTRDEMPAADDEIREAEAEGIKIMYLVSPQEITGEDKVAGIRALNYVLGETDVSGRRKPVEVPGTEFLLAVDTVLAATGQTFHAGIGVPAPGTSPPKAGGRISVSVPPQPPTFPGGLDLERTARGAIRIDEHTCATNVEGVYAGGDCARGPQSVITAIADGKRAAAAIDRQISGDKAFLVPDPEKTMADKDAVLERTGNRPRERRPQLGVGSRLSSGGRAYPRAAARSWDDCSPVLTEEQAVAEASRCLACGCGAGCQICTDICKVFAWSMDAQGRTVLDEDKCVACGMCVSRCPNRNIEMIQTGTENLVE